MHFDKQDIACTSVVHHELKSVPVTTTNDNMSHYLSHTNPNLELAILMLLWLQLHVHHGIVTLYSFKNLTCAAGILC